jgi:subtilase family protein
MEMPLILLLGWAAVGWPVLLQQTPDVGPSQRELPAFVLRVNPKLASKINEVLSRIARRSEVTIPTNQTAKKYLTEICSGYSPTYEMAEAPDTDATKVRVAPCIRIKRNVQVEVTAGDTLEGLAVRNGLPRSATERLKVIPAGESKARAVAPQDLKIGDRVVIPEVPQWTHVVVDPGMVRDRAALVSALASGLDCGTEEPEACLAERDVTVLDRATVRKPTPPEPTTFIRPRKLSKVMRMEVPLRAAATSRTAAVPSPASPEPPPPLPPRTFLSLASAPLAATEPESIPVAPEQWPYDVDLLAAILKEAADNKLIRASTTIGVADDGLGSLTGSPLPTTLFDVGVEELQGKEEGRTEPDGSDNDGNLYVDDIYGAGVPRFSDDESVGTGDIGLCKAEHLPFADWNPEPLSQASHGAVVSSVASALKLRKTAPQVVEALPKIVFFRMLESACAQDASFDVAEAEMVTAFEYLTTRSDVINISYIVDNDSGRRFASEVKDILPYYDKLLVLAAGNDTPGDLDDFGNCPPCLGNDSSDRGGPAAKRTLVVGAATRDLRRASYSNYGARTVGLFAPGEPTGALNLADQEVPDTEAATSYAAPLTALAAAIVRSFGGKNSPMDIKDRLLATTWPLNDRNSQPERSHVGVLDLVKAAAVRHHAVEVKETDPDGHVVRRTYVGRLLTPLSDLTLCAGRRFQEAGVHAIRLGEPADDGERKLLVYYRERIDQRTKRRLIEQVPCRPEGNLRISTLLHGEKIFPLAQVTQIQLRWLLGP